MNPQPTQPSGAATVVAIGNFDGVHRGHHAVLARARALAPEARLVVVTFWPHPMSVIRPGQAPKLLCSLDDRVALLRQAGADDVVVCPFTTEMAALSPEEFVAAHIAPLAPSLIVVGTNFRFGHRASGDVATLRRLGEWRVEALDLLETDAHTTSSTEVRRLLSGGDVAGAAHHLGRLFSFRGTVVVGHQRGRGLGFPTANLPVPAGFAAPADGVYAGWVTRLDDAAAAPWPAAISVGTNPTFDDVPEVVVEAHVLGRDDLELYGVAIAVDFVDRLRGNVRFEGIEQLVAQIGADCAKAKELLGARTPGE
ncbi:bifunctional riboflavin kinase/FAD synthetase [Mariniluteicoccus flavus]